MVEIDPWALPQGGAGTAGIPGAPAPQAVTGSKPLDRKLPIVVMVLASLYAVACVIEIFIVNSQVALAGQLSWAITTGRLTDDQVAQAKASDSHVTTGSWVAVALYFTALIAFIMWERRLKVDLGSVGARRAVLNKAGYSYFRLAWLVSFALGIFLSNQAGTGDIASMQDVINHDHQLMVYFGLRALLGLVLVFFAVRLLKISEEGVALLRSGRLGVL